MLKANAQARAKSRTPKRKREAREKAAAIWQAATPAPEDHGYLVGKGVKVHGVRVHDGALVIPMRDGEELHSLQFIDLDGDKRFLTGGRMSGCYFAMGTPQEVLCIAEGYATGASIYEATGYAVAIAFSTGNLMAVARALRAKFPDKRLILSADNDLETPGNPGLKKAQEAARAVRGLVAVPELDGRKCDFNDLILARGADAVRTAIVAAKAVLTDGSDEPPKLLSLRCASAIPIEPVSWLWSGWLAAGKLHVLAGVPGTGKTTIALSLAAIVTRGGHWPDGTVFRHPGNVLMWSGEDDPADTLVPRLAAMGADLSRVHFVGDMTESDGRRPFDPAHDMAALIAKAREIGDVRLLIVDPIVTTVAGDSHKNAEVRRGLAPLVTFGQELHAAVLGISHFSKGTGGRDPLDRITGSLAFGALARLVFGAAKQIGENGEEQGRVLVRIKSNLGPDGGAIGYSLALAELPQGIVTTRVTWGEKIEGNARDILADAEQTDADDGRGERQEATEFLRTLLANGPVNARQVLREAREAGHAEKTLRRAAKELGIRKEKESMDGGWVWQFPPKMATSAEDGHTKTLGTFGGGGHLRDAEAF